MKYIVEIIDITMNFIWNEVKLILVRVDWSSAYMV